MSLNLTRRSALLMAAATSALSACSTPAPAAEPELEGGHVFRHGVASGDLRTDSLVLWTRVEPLANAPQPVSWQLSRDADFTDIVASGEIETGPERDWTVKAIPTGLSPAPAISTASRRAARPRI